MQIHRIQIDNFRNFHHCELFLGIHAVIVGENKIGKSNLLHALRLILDPRMSDADRHLRLEDFWDGIPRPLKKDDIIQISIDLANFEDNESLIAILGDYLVQAEPMIARLTYIFRPLTNLEGEPQKESDYEHLVYGGDKPEYRFGYEQRQWIPLTVLPALRNAEEDLANWRQSPLAPLLRAAAAEMDPQELQNVASNVFKATAEVANLADIRALGARISDRLNKMVGPSHAVDTSLSYTPTDPHRLIRTLRLFIDKGVRSISEASLGCANLIYLSLLSLELERQVSEENRSHTFLAIEEPEAHLHPHLQRLAFRDFLNSRNQEAEQGTASSQTILLTTHAPHIVSVSPLKSIVLLKKSEDRQSTVGVSTANLIIDDNTICDLERYLDVNRGECVFAKGILLVEGLAEEFIIPALAKLLEYDFDQMGITVCSVGSANFEPYIHLFGPKGFNIPFAVLTDRDPQEQGTYLGEQRIIRLLKVLMDKAEFVQSNNQELLGKAEGYGLFLNNYTLEVDLFRSGWHQSIYSTLSALTANNAAKERMNTWTSSPEQLDPIRYLKDIDEIGKGRFAQRLASIMEGGDCPDYIRGAITYVAERVR